MALSLHMNATATWNSIAFSEVVGVDVVDELVESEFEGYEIAY